MTMKIAYAQILNDSMHMPAEVLAVLPQGVNLYLRTDPEKGTVTIYAKDPTDLPNKEIFDAFAELTADVNWETYTEPVPEELLRRPRKNDNEGEQ